MDRARVSPLAFGVSASDFTNSPLLQFQFTLFKKEDFRRLLLSINDAAPESEKLQSDILNRSFERGWKELDEEIGKIKFTGNKVASPSKISQSAGSREGSHAEKRAPTSVSLFDQGLIQVLQASVTRLEPKKPCILALKRERDGKGPLDVLAAFATNPAGSAIVNATGPIRQVVQGEGNIQRRYLVVAEGRPDKPGRIAQVQWK